MINVDEKSWPVTKTGQWAMLVRNVDWWKMQRQENGRWWEVLMLLMSVRPGRGVAGRGGGLRQDTAGQHGQAPHTPAHHRRRNAWMERPQALAWYHFRCIYLKWLVPAPSQASSPRGWAPPGTQRAGSCCRRIGRGTCGRVAAPQPLARRGSLGSLVYTLFK